MLTHIPQEALYVKGYDLGFPVINERKNELTIVYEHKRPFSLRIKVLNNNTVLVTDNFKYAVRTPINRVRKALKSYFKGHGFKTEFGNHAF